MAIRRQQLQRLQSESTSHDDSDDKKYAVWVSQTERKSHQSKCYEMFKLGARDDGTGVNWGQRRIHNESECQPACSNGYSLNHRR